MKNGDKFVIVLIVLSLGASVCYLIDKDYFKSLYWFAAGLINIAVMLM